MKKHFTKLKKFAYLLLVIPMLASFVYFLMEAYPATATPELVVAGPYDTPVSSGDSWGVNSSNPVREFVTVGQKYRVRQNGTINRVYLYTREKTGLTGFYVKIWRKSGSTYNLVGSSENIVSKLNANSFSTVDLSSPIGGVQEGDYIGFRIEGNQHNFYARSGLSDVTTYGVGNTTPSSTGYEWEKQTAYTGYAVPINVYMQAPEVVFIGDSIIAGHPGHYSFLESKSITNVDATMEKQFSNLTGYSYQNMGIGGQKTSEISARFKSDVISAKPQIVVIDGGINDILNYTVTKQEFIRNWTDMLNAAQSSGDIKTIVVLKMLPCSYGTAEKMRTRDNWNAALTALATKYSKAVVVDAGIYVGKYRNGGPAGNLWDIKDEYNADGVHYNQAGYTQIAKAIVDRLSKR